MSSPGQVFSREQLLSSVWGHVDYGGGRTVDVHVAQLRAKLGASSRSARCAASDTGIMRSLRARATLVTIAVAVIAVIVTGLISLQLVRSSVNQGCARPALLAQADILARMPQLATAEEPPRRRASPSAERSRWCVAGRHRRGRRRGLHRRRDPAQARRRGHGAQRCDGVTRAWC